MRVHVVGGRGFVGRAVVRALRGSGAAVRVSGRPAAGALLSDELLGDEDAEVLMWCAGQRSEDVAGMQRAHVEAACAAMGAMAKVRAVVYVSSGEIYGGQEVPFEESAARLGASVYARAKIRGEDALAAMCWRRGVALAIARPAVVYGPGQPEGMLVPSAVGQLVRGEGLEVTSGEQTRDWVYVDDVAAALAALARRKCEGIYNVSSEQEVSVRAMVAQIAAAVGGDAAARVRWGARAQRAGEVARYALSATRARAELGWRATTTLETGLEACVLAARGARAAQTGSGQG
jgi:nucleoside-diphosphate-sugar epimerase